MFGIGGFEFFIICLFGLIIFGPDKMPQLGRTIGRTMRQFQKVQDDMKKVISAEMYASDPNKDTSPFKPKESVLKKYEKEEEKVVGASASTSSADALYGLDQQPASPAADAAPAAADAGQPAPSTAPAEQAATPEGDN